MAAIFSLIAIPAFATDYHCASEVTLSGTLTTRIGTGLDETKTNDAPVRYPALSMDIPINMTEKNPNPDDPAECSDEKYNVRDELVPDNLSIYRRNIGKRARVACRTIYPPMTSHHLSDIVCEVEKPEIIKQ